MRYSCDHAKVTERKPYLTCVLLEASALRLVITNYLCAYYVACPHLLAVSRHLSSYEYIIGNNIWCYVFCTLPFCDGQ